MGKESRMRNDVKLGLAVGGLLLGVVLAYALLAVASKADYRSVADKAAGNLGLQRLQLIAFNLEF